MPASAKGGIVLAWHLGQVVEHNFDQRFVIMAKEDASWHHLTNGHPAGTRVVGLGLLETV